MYHKSIRSGHENQIQKGSYLLEEDGTRKGHLNAQVTGVVRVKMYRYKGHLYLLALFIKLEGGSIHVCIIILHTFLCVLNIS